ncbi:EthD domain-containing protein [Roseofilum capinflatum]|uniref:EthD domain-containing protein n=1 Tax=Roseofilum capinflatum BLCC-M114 TaxID=3022440 RepID=A0ABT7B5U1_9CYAN|nr:EthD domain-containing protein [Roseofilum capinflatum]MDJ1174485.1 EthD domain-containing protein [Roseofilum capinflatum BLCC-M114]
MPDYSERDKQAVVTNYAVLWKRADIDLETFDGYWGHVHGPVCVRLPGLYQYWQHQVHHNLGGIWPEIEGVTTRSLPEENFDGVAELTFKSNEDRLTWFKAFQETLTGDDANFLSHIVIYTTSPGNSVTYYDELENGQPTGLVSADKFNIIVRKKDSVKVAKFHKWMKETLAPALAKAQPILKVRMHLFDETTMQPDFQGAIEISFTNRLALRNYLASDDYQQISQDISKYLKSFQPYPQRGTFTLAYEGEPTLTGEWGITGAQMIETVGAVNQTQPVVRNLMLGNG